MIIDAHLHLPVIPEPRSYEQAKVKLLEDMRADQVNYAILIPDNLPNSEIGNVPVCLRLVRDTPELLLMGTIDIQTQGQEWIKELERLITQRLIVGMKIFPGHDPIYPTDPRLDPVYALCQANDLPMVIHTGWNSDHPEAAQYNDPKTIVQVAERYPRLRLVIAHFFWPEVDYCYAVTHNYPNIYFDEMRYFVELGASPMETIVAATKNGALILGMADELGTVEAGKLADLQVLGADPLKSFDALGKPEIVFVNGKVH